MILSAALADAKRKAKRLRHGRCCLVVEVDRGEVYAWRCWCEPQTTRDLEVLMRQVPRRRDD